MISTPPRTSPKGTRVRSDSSSLLKTQPCTGAYPTPFATCAMRCTTLDVLDTSTLPLMHGPRFASGALSQPRSRTRAAHSLTSSRSSLQLVHALPPPHLVPLAVGKNCTILIAEWGDTKIFESTRSYGSRSKGALYPDWPSYKDSFSVVRGLCPTTCSQTMMTPLFAYACPLSTLPALPPRHPFPTPRSTLCLSV